ncbi:type II secretion system F family protein [Kiloniella sp. EL199]|uniref:type II secretion system F family protein n=1 Tax=Kiloniella sp. EL199 TaxID=2107581 RepID=UPI000EA0D941|nr:type II secretion system F family protein [Kiloniella sp. EL199]
MISFFRNIASGQASDLEIMTAIVVVLFLFFILLYLILKPDNKQVKSRINRIVNNTKGDSSSNTAQISIRRQAEGSGNVKLDELIHRLTPKPDLLRENMQKAGLHPNLGHLLIISIFIGIISFASFQFTTKYPPFLGVLFGIAFGLSAPHFGLYVLKKRRQKKFLALFPDAIDLMVRALKAGLPITEAIKNSGEEIANPVGIELSKVTNGVKIGGKLPDELQKAQHRLGLQEFQFFTVALSIQTETGGNLAETLANLSDILRKRKQMQLKIKAMSSEAKASAYIIGSLPFIMFFLIYLMNPEYATVLLTDPRGQFALGLGLFSIALGCGIMYKMVKFEI